MKRGRLAFQAVVPFLLVSAAAKAEPDFWLGETAAWTNGSNWSLNRPPAADETAAFTNDAPYPFAPLPAAAELGRFEFTGAAPLALGAALGPFTLHGIEGVGLRAGPGAGSVNFGTARFVLAAPQCWRHESAALVTNNGTIANGGNGLTVDGAGDGPFCFGPLSVISGGGGLTVDRSGAGPVVLAAASTYTGPTAVSNGTLRIAVANALPSAASAGNVTLEENGVLDLNGYSQTLGALSGSGRVDSARGTGLATLTVGVNNQSASFWGTLTNTAGLVALTKIGTGTQTVGGVLSHGGLTTVNLGKLRLGAPDVLPHGPAASNVAVTTAGTCLLDLNGFDETLNAVTGAGIVTNSGGDATLTLGAADATAVSGVAFRDGAGVLNLVKTGSGTLTLSGANTLRGGVAVLGGTLVQSSAALYRGPTLVSNATLKAGIANALPALTNSANLRIEENGVLDLNAFSTGSGALDGNGLVDNRRGTGTYTLTAGANNRPGFFSGVIANTSGTVAFTKSGTNTQVLAGSNTYSGPTTVSLGTLRVGASGAIPNGPGKGGLAITTAGTCLFDLNGFDETVNGLSGAGTVTNSAGTAVLTLGDANATSSSTTPLRDGGGVLGITKIGTGTNTLGGAISLRGEVRVESGLLVLSAANTYTGRTTVAGGTLRVANAAGSATGPGPVEVGPGAALQGTGRSLGDLLLDEGARLQPGLPGGACGALTVSNVTWTGGAILECEVTNLASGVYGAGVHYDLLVVTGALDALPAGGRLVIRLDSRGALLPVDPARNYSLKVVTFGAEPVLDPADIELDTNAFLAAGTWAVTNRNRMIVVYQQNQPDPVIWTGSGSWSNPANWSAGRPPAAGDRVLFDWNSTAACTADAVSNDLASLTLESGYGGTVTFAKNAVEGGMDLRVAEEIRVQSGNLVFGCDLLSAGAGTPTNRWGAGYTVTVARVHIAAGAALHTDGMGFDLGGGPGGSYHNTAKGAPSHGGQGGGPDRSSSFYNVALRPAVYGTARGPTSLGSGYKSGSENDNNPGGGALKLNVSDTVTVLGRLSADAANRFAGKYPGAGGSLWIAGGTLLGNGRLSANGTLAGAAYGAGGGGRIDLRGTTNHFTGLIQTILPQASGLSRGQAGSLLLPREGSGATVTNLIGTNLVFGSSLTFDEPVVIRAGTLLALDANAGENTFTFSSLTIQSGGVVRCLGNVPEINPGEGGSSLNPHGMGPVLQAGTLTIEKGGSLNADAQGCPYGPGFYTNAAFPAGVAAGGHGGRGGQGSGVAYGSLTNMSALGSGDGATPGGGSIRLTVDDTLTVDGTLSCQAGAPPANRSGGAGGSLWIACGTLSGSGVIAADGGPAATTGRNAGGGGRLAILAGALDAGSNPFESGRVSACGGASLTNRGAAGTVYLAVTGAVPSITLCGLNDLPATNTATLLGSPLEPVLVADRILLRHSPAETPTGMVLIVSSIFSNGAAFQAGPDSILAFAGSPDAAVYGSSRLSGFVISNETVKTVRFEPGSTNTVERLLLLDRARLLSGEDGSAWHLNLAPGGAQDIRRVAVRDSHAGGGQTLHVLGLASESANLGHNVNWRFRNGGLILLY